MVSRRGATHYTRYSVVVREVRLMIRALARCILFIGGWTAVGGAPNVPKAVYIAAPHTSNWDGIWTLVFKVAAGIDVKFFAKDSLFWFPLGTLLQALGGIPLDRSRADSAVSLAVKMFAAHDSFYFGLAPEGTRSLRDGWKTGFYRMALEANVPVFLGFLDYPSKRVGVGARLDPTGDADADLKVCADFYADIEGRWPENASPVCFPHTQKTAPEGGFDEIASPDR